MRIQLVTCPSSGWETPTMKKNIKFHSTTYENINHHPWSSDWETSTMKQNKHVAPLNHEQKYEDHAGLDDEYNNQTSTRPQAWTGWIHTNGWSTDEASSKSTNIWISPWNASNKYLNRKICQSNTNIKHENKSDKNTEPTKLPNLKPGGLPSQPLGPIFLATALESIKINSIISVLKSLGNGASTIFQKKLGWFFQTSTNVLTIQIFCKKFGKRNNCPNLCSSLFWKPSF